MNSNAVRSGLAAVTTTAVLSLVAATLSLPFGTPLQAQSPKGQLGPRVSEVAAAQRAGSGDKAALFTEFPSGQPLTRSQAFATRPGVRN